MLKHFKFWMLFLVGLLTLGSALDLRAEQALAVRGPQDKSGNAVPGVAGMPAYLVTPPPTWTPTPNPSWTPTATWTGTIQMPSPSWTATATYTPTPYLMQANVQASPTPAPFISSVSGKRIKIDGLILTNSTASTSTVSLFSSGGIFWGPVDIPASGGAVVGYGIMCPSIGAPVSLGCTVSTVVKGGASYEAVTP